MIIPFFQILLKLVNRKYFGGTNVYQERGIREIRLHEFARSFSSGSIFFSYLYNLCSSEHKHYHVWKSRKKKIKFFMKTLMLHFPLFLM